jgi:hypothetical protein
MTAAALLTDMCIGMEQDSCENLLISHFFAIPAFLGSLWP